MCFQETFDPRICCRYKEGILPYYRFKQELLSVTPFVTLFYDVITDKEIDALMQVARDKVQFLTGDPRQFVSFGPNVRENILGIKGGWREIANYGIGGQYGLHWDFLAEALKEEVRNHEASLYGGDRLATFLIYLTDVERGGSTVFNKLGLAVSPVKKMALFWYNAKPSGELDYTTQHAGCPVVVGHKWVSNKWMWNYGNTFTRRCGLTPDATQLDIELYMRKGWV
ncbi:unnamed protein product [Candidula unifasciata]|uniref:Fe2OG dioxygenase domain-containing protein n=1 Tax=Candidula unifasciata TaxID=100452 RepID=A0A8S3YBB8_9EUPU|nr:unnamed protein product [Candidula unifasciata]